MHACENLPKHACRSAEATGVLHVPGVARPWTSSSKSCPALSAPVWDGMFRCSALVSMSACVGFDRQLRRKRTPTQFDQLEDLPSPAEVLEGPKASSKPKTFAARPLKRWISIPSSQETADPTCIGARTIACTAWQRTHVHFPRLPGERGRGCAEAGKARRPARGMRGGRADQADQCRRLACFGLPLPPSPENLTYAHELLMTLWPQFLFHGNRIAFVQLCSSGEGDCRDTGAGETQRTWQG